MDPREKKALGNWGEQEAAHYLERRGLRIIDRQYRQPWGEIDLIAQDGATCVFIEVKTRTSPSQVPALESINWVKQRRIIRAAMSYMKWKRLEAYPLRFDVVLIEGGHVEWIPNAFQSTSYYTY